MKKIILVILVLISLYILSNNEVGITKDAIRFRVIANSNSSKDVIMKEKVVNELSSILFKENNSIDETRENIINNIKNIENKIDKVFINNDYDMDYNISYGNNYFPKKTYNNQTFDEGYYESLVIEIGESKGNNYWCVLYPPLCMVDDNFDNNEVNYSFKLFEIIRNLF